MASTLPSGPTSSVRPHTICDNLDTNRDYAVGHWLFTELLLSALVSAPDSTAKPRIVTLSSCAAYISKLDFDTFTDTPARLKKGDIGLYAQSKYVSVGSLRRKKKAASLLTMPILHRETQ